MNEGMDGRVLYAGNHTDGFGYGLGFSVAGSYLAVYIV